MDKNDIEGAYSRFNKEISVVEVVEAPQLTRFRVEPGRRYTPTGRERKDYLTVRQIKSSLTDVGVALGVGGLTLKVDDGEIWIEVPKKSSKNVSLPNSQAGDGLWCRFGETVKGKEAALNLRDSISPHVLIAGQTGSGKSVCINAMLCSLVRDYSPEDLSLFLIDPKRVELTPFVSAPHSGGMVFRSPPEALAAIKILVAVMEHRYQAMAQEGVRDFKQLTSGGIKLKFEVCGRRKDISLSGDQDVVIVIDEYADLVMSDRGKEIERQLTLIAQKGRAAGLHIILATQYPTADVVNSVVKANFPARVAFTMASAVNSRVVLDSAGAEKLAGRGDGILSVPGRSVRFQGSFVSDDEVHEYVQGKSRQWAVVEPPKRRGWLSRLFGG
jgi:S-DNA-T family DNA segregation ATPase FtsK/SpoIIIE